MSSGRKEEEGTATPPVFCKGVRKPLMPKELAKCSFLRGAEDCENRGVSFWLFLQVSGRAMRDERREWKKDNAETLRAQRFRGEDGDAGRGWKARFTVYVTATRDNLSKYFLCSNDPNGARMEPKLIRGMGMDGNLVRGNGVCARPVVASEGSEVKSAV